MENLNATETYLEIKDKIGLYTYYIIIGVLSLIVTIFIPLVGSNVGIQWNFPDTTAGWMIFITVRLTVSFINILIFHNFVCQGKLNIKNDKNYLEANRLLNKISKEKRGYIPKSPNKFLGGLYIKKGTTIFITSALALVAFSQAILTYNWQDLLTYSVVLIFGIIFGVMTMFKVQEYWTTEYLDYAMQQVSEFNNSEERMETVC